LLLAYTTDFSNNPVDNEETDPKLLEQGEVGDALDLGDGVITDVQRPQFRLIIT
jgi:hypothetical protein